MVPNSSIDLLKCTHKALCIFFLALLFYVVLLWESKVNEKCFTFCSESAEAYSHFDMFQKQISQHGAVAKKLLSPASMSFVVAVVCEEKRSSV